MKRLTIIFCLLVATFSAEAVNRDILSVYSWQEKGFKKIEDVDVPADILKAASAKYSGYSLTQAYRSEDGESGDGEFKLILAKDRRVVNAYYKATGEFIKEETIK